MKAQQLVDQWKSWILRPRVVHRLPGRLRLSVPAIKQVDDTQREWALVWRDLLTGVAEIESVDLNLTTGSVLIRYHPDEISEAELLDFLRAVNRLALRHWDQLAALPPVKAPEALRRLVAVLRSGIRRPLALDDKLEIPSDVWA